MLKLVGVSMIMLSFAAMGAAASGRLSERTERLSQTELLLCEAKTQIRFCSTPMFELFRELSGRRELSKLEFAGRLSHGNAESFQEAWKRSINADAGLFAAERDILLALGGSLGLTDTDGQLAALELASERIAAVKDAAFEERRQKSKLRFCLGVLAGAVVSVLLI